MFSCSGGSNERDSEPFSVIPRSPLSALCQHFFEMHPYLRKYRGNICREPAFLRQSAKRDLPIRWRRNQSRGQIVRSSSLKGQTQCVQNPPLIQPTRPNQESHVHQVLHSAVRCVPRERDRKSTRLNSSHRCIS